jgi:hypothetical protein
METQELFRAYNGSDAFLAENARATQMMLVSDLSLFTAFDSSITAAYATQFLTAVTAADTVVADTAIIDQLVQKTELIFTAMDKAKNKYNDVKYFVQKAFPNSAATQGEFGLNDYEKARKNASQMIQFLDEMSKACVKYQTQLVAAGYTATAITAIQTIRTELLTANSNQEVFKKQRPKLTEDRIRVLNTCYNYVTQINAAAQLVFRNDYAKQKQYVFNPSSTSETQEFTGTVAANTIKNIATIAFSSTNVFTFKNTGLAPLVFCLATTANLEGVQIAIGGGATITKSASELNANATNLLVKNNDALLEGSYEIELDS